MPYTHFTQKNHKQQTLRLAKNPEEQMVPDKAKMVGQMN